MLSAKVAGADVDGLSHREWKLIVRMLLAGEHDADDQSTHEALKFFSEVELQELAASRKQSNICARPIDDGNTEEMGNYLWYTLGIKNCDWEILKGEGRILVGRSSNPQENVCQEELSPNIVRKLERDHRFWLQCPETFLSVFALNPQSGQTIVDVASSVERITYIASRMKNTGRIHIVIENEIEAQKCPDLLSAFPIFEQHKSEVEMCKSLGSNSVDGLLWGPTSSGGSTNYVGRVRDNNVIIPPFGKVVDSTRDLKARILSMIDIVKTNGFMVYTTSSNTVYENEEVIDHALKHRDVEVVETALEYGNQGFILRREFQDRYTKMKRFYPTVHGVDVCFIAKLLKRSNTSTSTIKSNSTSTKVSSSKAASSKAAKSR